MKKICNLVRLWIGALALWETIASYYKDQSFRENLQNAKGFEKCKVILNNLIDVNKNLISDVKTVDYNSIKNEYKEILDSKIAYVNKKIDYLKTEWDKLNQDKLQPLLNDIQTKYNEVVGIVWTKKEALLEKYGPELEKLQTKLNESVDKIKDKIAEIKKN